MHRAQIVEGLREIWQFNDRIAAKFLILAANDDHCETIPLNLLHGDAVSDATIEIVADAVVIHLRAGRGPAIAAKFSVLNDN